MNAPKRRPSARRAAVEIEPGGSGSSGTRKRAEDAEAKADDADVFALLTKLADEGDGLVLPPGKWVQVADAAKRAGYIEEHGLRLYLKKRGQQELASRAAPAVAAKGRDMTLIFPADKLTLKDLSHEVGVPMRETLGHIVQALYEHRDELTRIARAARLEYPWEAIGVLVKQRR